MPPRAESWKDFIEGLPKSEDKEVIMVVVDRFTKYAYFLSLKHPYTVQHVVDLFLDTIYKLHGLPAVIVSDRDRIFRSTLWQELFKALGVKLDSTIQEKRVYYS